MATPSSDADQADDQPMSKYFERRRERRGSTISLYEMGIGLVIVMACTVAFSAISVVAAVEAPYRWGKRRNYW